MDRPYITAIERIDLGFKVTVKNWETDSSETSHMVSIETEELYNTYDPLTKEQVVYLEDSDTVTITNNLTDGNYVIRVYNSGSMGYSDFYKATVDDGKIKLTEDRSFPFSFNPEKLTFRESSRSRTPRINSLELKSDDGVDFARLDIGYQNATSSGTDGNWIQIQKLYNGQNFQIEGVIDTLVNDYGQEFLNGSYNYYGWKERLGWSLKWWWVPRRGNSTLSLYFNNEWTGGALKEGTYRVRIFETKPGPHTDYVEFKFEDGVIEKLDTPSPITNILADYNG